MFVSTVADLLARYPSCKEIILVQEPSLLFSEISSLRDSAITLDRDSTDATSFCPSYIRFFSLRGQGYGLTYSFFIHNAHCPLF